MDYEKVLGGLALAMTVFTIGSIYGIGIFLFSDSPVSYEGLYITGYIWFFSLLIQIPYGILLIVKLQKTSLKLKVVTLVPFVIMWLAFGYGVINGMSI